MTKSRIKLLPDEKAEAKVEKQKIKDKKSCGGMGDLEKMILAKRDNTYKGFLGYMEQKYCQDEPDEIHKP